jgi:hypothetical protein
MMRTATVTIDCPACLILQLNLGKMRVDPVFCTTTLTFDDGELLAIRQCYIPATVVNRVRALNWLVEACQMNGADAYGNKIALNIPPQPVIYDMSAATFVAKSIDSQGLVELRGGGAGTVQANWPDCQVNMHNSPFSVAAVTARGEAIFPIYH